MTQTRLVAFACIVVLCGVVFAKPKESAQAKTEILVACAASLKDAMNELIIAYQEKNPTMKIITTYGASGALQRQIEAGAPVDIFISAASKQMTALQKEGLVDSASVKTLFTNSLVLIAPKRDQKLTSFADAGGEKVKSIALGETASVPAGQYAEQVFTALGIAEAVKAKAVYGKDVRQVLAYVASGEVDAGVVYATDAAMSPAVRVVAVASEQSHDTIVYPAAIVSASAQKKEAEKFLSWLSKKEARAVFTRYGFKVEKLTTPEQAPGYVGYAK